VQHKSTDGVTVYTEASTYFCGLARESVQLEKYYNSFVLGGIRQLHIVMGFPAPELRSDLLKLVLKGIANRNGIARRQKNWAGRLPMTFNAMLLFKSLLRNSSLLEWDKALIWAVATLAFTGAFRIHKIKEGIHI
jgi:hypothetical protein